MRYEAMGIDYQKILNEDPEETKKLEEKMKVITDIMSGQGDAGKMNDELYVEITARMKCDTRTVYSDEEFKALISDLDITNAEYAAYAYKVFAETESQTAKEKVDLLMKSIDTRVAELKKTDCVPQGKTIDDSLIYIPDQKKLQAEGMNEAKWVEIMGLFICLPKDAEITDKQDWIFSAYKVTIEELLDYQKQMKERSDYQLWTGRVHDRYLDFNTNGECAKVNGTSYLDDKALWKVVKCKIFKKCEVEVPEVSTPKPEIVPPVTLVEEVEQVLKEKPPTYWEKVKCKVKKFFGGKCKSKK
jgi:hypothetical protein